MAKIKANIRLSQARKQLPYEAAYSSGEAAVRAARRGVRWLNRNLDGRVPPAHIQQKILLAANLKKAAQAA